MFEPRSTFYKVSLYLFSSSIVQVQHLNLLFNPVSWSWSWSVRCFILQCGSICRISILHLASQHHTPDRPLSSVPDSDETTAAVGATNPNPLPQQLGNHALPPGSEREVASVLHPRVAVLLGVDRRYHLPLLLCRLLSIAPAGWWIFKVTVGLLVKYEELLRDPSMLLEVEMVLAVLWV